MREWGGWIILVFVAGCLGPSADPPSAASPASDEPLRESRTAARSSNPGDLARTNPAPPYAATPSYQVMTACIPITIGPTSLPMVVVGTAFLPRGQSNVTRSVVLVPGNGFTREYFDGGPWRHGVDNDTTLPRLLARAGFAVITIDRPGMGESMLNETGGGVFLTTDEQANAMDRVVQAIKAGVYGLGDCSSPTRAPFGSPHIVFGGHSFGGLMAMMHATRFGGVDGYLMFQIATQGVSQENAAYTLACQARQAADEYGYAICPGDLATGEGPVSQSCIDVFLTKPERVPISIRDEVCLNENMRTEARAAFADITPMLASINAGVTQVPNVPVLLLFAQFDGSLNGGAENEDQSNRDGTIENWSGSCPCAEQLETHTMMGTGHLAAYYDNYFEMNARVLAFLAGHDLLPTAES